MVARAKDTLPENCRKIAISNNVGITLIMALPRHLSAMAFHEKAGRSQVNSSCFFVDKVFLPPSGHCRHASIRTLSRNDSFRSVHVGRSRFSRCCHLFGALWFCSFRAEPGPGHRRSHRNSALGFLTFLFLERL